MVGWQRHFQTVLGHLQRRVGNTTSAANRSLTSHNCHIHSSSTCGDVVGLQRLWKLPHSIVQAALYQHQQISWISSSRQLLSSDVSPISSPLIPALTSGTTGTSEAQKAVTKPSTVQAILKGIKMSPKKLNLVAALVRGMRVEDALLQLQVTVKRASKIVYQVIHSARANATRNHGLEADKLLVAEAFVGKGLFKKRASFHAKGRTGVKVRPECRLTVVVREITADEEADIARLKVHNFKKMTKRERRLVPHQLIETTPVWDRKGRNNNSMSTA